MLFKWIILPLLIVIARVLDVSLQTLRIVFVSRGLKKIAPIVGFFEVFIWIVAIQQIMKNMDNMLYFVAYAGGFALGSYLGIEIERKLALGMSVIRIITKKDASKLIEVLRAKNYGVTNISAEGATGPVNVVYIVIRRADVQEVVELIQKYNPKAFFIIEEVSRVSEGIFPAKTFSFKKMVKTNLLQRKGK